MTICGIVSPPRALRRLCHLALVPLLAVLAAAQADAAPAVPAHAPPDCQGDGPFPTLGPNPYPLCPGPRLAGELRGGNCTWWVWQRWHFYGVDMRPTRDGRYPNAKDWAEGYQGVYEQGKQPREKAIMVFQPGYRAGPDGHVAFVERVNRDGSFVVSSQGWGSAVWSSSLTLTQAELARPELQGKYTFIYFPEPTRSDRQPVVPPPAHLSAMPAAGGNLSLTWSAVPGADAYTVYRQDPSGPVHAIAHVGTTTYVDVGVGCGTRPRYWVTATGGSGESALSLPLTATASPCPTAGQQPATRPWSGAAPCTARVATLPRPTSPPNCSTLTAFQTVLEWANPPGARQVEVRLLPFNADGPGLNLVRNVEGGTGRLPLTAAPAWYFLLPDMTYTWSVRTTTAPEPIGPDDPRWGPWSPAWGFRTPARASASITPVAPADGATVRAGPAVLQWENRASDVFYYEVQVSRNPGFNPDPATATSFVWWNLVHGGASTPPNAWTTPDLEPGTTYYWRVRPRVQGDGTPVAWSPTWSFTVAP